MIPNVTREIGGGELHPPFLRRDLDRDRAGVRDEDHRSPEDARRRPERHHDSEARQTLHAERRQDVDGRGV